MRQEIVFRIGRGLDLASLLRPELRRHVDRAAYFLDLLRHKTRIDGRPVRLLSKHLGNVMGRTVYTAIVDDLQKAGIVTRSRSYRPGERAKEYLLSRAYLTLEKVEYRPTNRFLLANVRKSIKARMAKATQALVDPIIAFIHSQILRVRLDDALVAAAIDRESDADKRHGIRSVAEQIRCREFVVREDNQGRVYHPLTSLPKEIRRSATVDGESLCEIDVVSSQPLLVPVIYRLWADVGCRFSRLPVHSIEKHSDSFVSTPHPSPPTGCSQQTEIGEFQAWCEQGVVYERLAELVGWDAGSDESRASVKQRVFRSLLYANGAGLMRPGNELATAFRAKFPGIFSMLCDAQHRTLVDSITHKRVKSRSSAPSGKTAVILKSVLPFYMQRIESQIVVRGVVPRWMTEKPGRFLSTIHDSLLVAESDAEDAAQMLRDEFASVGLFPQVKVSGSRART